MQPATSSRPGLLTVFSHAKTYEYLAYNLWSLPAGILYFVLTITGLALGIGLAVLFIGLPILGSAFAFARKLTTVEARIAAKLLDLPYEQPLDAPLAQGGMLKQLLAQLANPAAWTGVTYVFIKFVYGIFAFTVTISFVAVALGLLFSPLIYHVLTINDLWGHASQVSWTYILLGERMTLMEEAWLNSAIGLPMLFIALHLSNAIARFQALLAISFGR